MKCQNSIGEYVRSLKASPVLGRQVVFHGVPAGAHLCDHKTSSRPAFRAFFSFTRESRRMPRMKKKIRERIEFLDEPVKCRIMAKMNGPQTAENLLTTE